MDEKKVRCLAKIKKYIILVSGSQRAYTVLLSYQNGRFCISFIFYLLFSFKK